MKLVHLIGAVALVTVLSACQHMMMFKMPDTYKVYFAFDSSDISENGAAVIKKAVRDTKGAKYYTISLEGYADPQGNAMYNKMLAKKRVIAVKNALMVAGITKDHIHVDMDNDMMTTGANWQKRVVEIDVRTMGK